MYIHLSSERTPTRTSRLGLVPSTVSEVLVLQSTRRCHVVRVANPTLAIVLVLEGIHLATHASRDEGTEHMILILNDIDAILVDIILKCKWRI